VILRPGEHNKSRRSSVLRNCRCCTISTGCLHSPDRHSRERIGDDRRPVGHGIDGRTLSLLRFCQGSGRTEGAPRSTHGKSVHWHIDQLTERGRVIGSWIVPNGRECELVAMLGSLPMPILGFGSSDCRRCRSHLLYRPIGVSVPLTGFNETAPYGSWKSPLVSDLIAAQSISLSEPRICWWETLRR